MANGIFVSRPVRRCDAVVPAWRGMTKLGSRNPHVDVFAYIVWPKSSGLFPSPPNPDTLGNFRISFGVLEYSLLLSSYPKGWAMNFLSLMTRSLVVLLALFIAVAASGASDPKQLQEQAIKRIDAFVEHFRKTGDFKSRVAELLTPAQDELVTSYRGFMQQNDLASATLSLVKLGNGKRMLGQWQPAIELYQEAAKTAQTAGHPAHQADALTGLALAENSSGKSASALTHIEQAIPLATSISDKKYLFDALDVKAEILISLGNLSAAAESLNRAFTLAEGLNEEKLIFGYLDRGDVYWQLANKCDAQKNLATCQKQYDLAKADYTKMQALAQKLGWNGLAKQAAEFSSHVDIKKNMLASQGQVSEQFQKSATFNPKQPGDVLVSEQFAVVNPDIAETLAPIYEESKRNEKRMGGFADTVAARSAHTEGLIRQTQGDLDGALSSYLKAVDLVEKDRGKISDEQTRGKFVEDKISFYHAPALVYLEQKRVAEAFSLLERSKSRAMADLLANKALTLSNANDRALYAASLQLRTRIANQQQQLFELIASGGKQEQIAEKNAAILALEEEYRQHQARMAQEAPKTRELTLATSATLAQLQRAMQTERFETLQYLVQETGVILWHIAADSVHVRNVFIPRHELIRKIAALQKSLADRNGKFDEQTAQQLFLYLVQPVLGRIKTERLLIIPHEELHGLSFQALLNPGDRRFLGERFQLSFAPSATVFLGLKRAASIQNGKLLAIADPDIEAAQKEVDAIAEIYAQRNKVVNQTLAKEADVKTMVGDYDVVHLSVHGKFDASEPLSSYLKFSAGGQDDGKLTAAEIFGLPLEKARLVVLSACETGKAEVTHGDEVIGLVRALLYAGANSLVLSQWEVDAESTALWMQTFYREAQSKPLPEAARLALLAVKSHKDFGHPYYWAAFTMVTR